MRLSIKSLASNSVVRWWVVGLIGTALDLLLLYVLVDVMRLNLLAATFVAGEFATLMRFVVNDRWVFGHRSPTWKRLWQYHLAVLLSFVVWWGTTNLLAHFGVYYLLAAVLATGFSVVCSMLTNFLWVWRKRSHRNNLKPPDYPN